MNRPALAEQTGTTNFDANKFDGEIDMNPEREKSGPRSSLLAISRLAALVLIWTFVAAFTGFSPLHAQEGSGESSDSVSDSEVPQEEPQEENKEIIVVDPEKDAEAFATKEDIMAIQIPIMDREPFDRLTFNQNNLMKSGEVWLLDVDQLQLDGVSAVQEIDPKNYEGRLIFTIEASYPNRQFACPWTSLSKVERYADLVMAEANAAMERADYGTAFRTLLFLMELEGFQNTAKLKGMMDKCLYEDGHENLEAGKFGEALSAFDALFEREPRYPVRGAKTLLDKITTCINEFIKDKIDKGDFDSARSLLSNMRIEYGTKVEKVVRFWELDMKQRAITQLRDVKRDADAGNGMAAHQGARDVMYVMPSLKASVNAYNAVITKFPFVFVGVTQQAGSLDVRKIEDWAARRVGFMVNRWLLEFQKPSDEGGKYLFPAGTIQPIDELGLKYRMKLHAETPYGVPDMKSFELQDRLFELATVGSDEYYIPWARLVESIEIEDERSIVFTLKYPHVRPQALLVMPWFPSTDARAVEFFGKYHRVQANEGEEIFELNDRYPKKENEQNPRIVERVFRDSSQATQALIEGRLDVVDRIYPGDITRLKKNPKISVKPYLIPSVHMLIPNPRNDYMKSDSFRRALHFGINRKLIIRDVISGGREIDGFEVVSGPFPKGTEAASDLAYAYNFKVSAREHSALLGLVLAQQFVTQEKQRLQKEGIENPQVEMPKVVLAYPATETIKASCEIITQQWRAIGVETELRALPPGVTIPEDDDYDLVYVETQMQEPLIDAYRMFGRGGLSKLVDPTIEQALRNLDSAYSWKKVSDALRRVHQQSANNLSILPLWQVVDHYAYRKNVFNLGSEIVFLYENLNEWRIDKVAMPEEPKE